MKKRGLGRRLEELLAGSNKTVGIDSVTSTAINLSSENASDNEAASAQQHGVGLRLMPIDRIQPGRYQPRKVFQDDALQELAESIKAQGVIQPVVLRPSGKGYELIAGERRWRAAQIAGLHDIPAIVQEISDDAAIAMGLIENIQREDLNPIEEAVALQRLIDEFEMSHLNVAEAIGRSRTSVTNLLRLLKLNPDVRTLLEHGDIDAGHAKALLALEGLSQSDAARAVVDKGMTVRETESYIRKLQQPKVNTSQPVDPNIQSLQNELSDRLGAKIQIKQSAKGKGKLIISYNSNDELEGIIEKIH
ncbi:MAG: chromosome partitioning protein ParB [Legionellaceae bacterium]|nr:chromosome partitioning protein ParB [Legionellaceae bacterium]